MPLVFLLKSCGNVIADFLTKKNCCRFWKTTGEKSEILDF